MAFSGGSKPFSPFTVNASQAAQPGGTGSFTFGTGQPAATGFNFGTGATQQPAAGGATAGAPQLSFTAATPAAPATSSLFNFGGTSAGTAAPVASAPSAPLGFGFNPAGSTGTTTTSLAGAFGGATQQQPTLSFGAPTAAPTSSSLTSLGTTATPISFTSAPPASAANTVQPTFGVPAPAAATQATAAPTSVATSTTATAPPQTGFNFGTGSTPLNVTNPVKPTITTAAGTGTTTSTGAGTGDASATPATQLTTATTTTQSNAAVSQMNFRQLQEAINKWMLDLQDQEKIFLEQATKVNAWDRTLIINGDKIAKLNESITKVKNDHNRLEHALDYLKTQQQEFEAFLEPLEAGLPMNIPVEPEREQLYSLTENVDTQLQQMAEDLKEVIRHINESNKTVDKNDPVSQILRILNEHTDALQWVEDNANQVRRSLEDVSKQHQMAKKEHERSLRQMFK